MIIFLITPGSIFERFWAPNSPPIGETNLPIFDVFSIMEPSWPQKLPKDPIQDASWNPQDLSQSPLATDC